MESTKRLLGLLAVMAALAAAQPVVDGGGVVNAASYALTGLPNAGIAQGSIFIVFGRAMGPATLQQAGFPLPTELAGTSVRVTVSGQTVNALMIYTSATQLACVLPSRTPVGTGTLQVTYNQQTSNPAPITVVKSSFGIFTLNQAGNGPGIFTDPNYAVNTLSWSAQPNEIWVVWGTGLGPVTFDESRGAPVQDLVDSDVEVYVGLKKAEIRFRGRTPGSSGLDQINFRIPPGLDGCYVPVFIKTGGVVSNVVSISVASGKRTCKDELGLSDAEIETAKERNDFRIGSVTFQKLALTLAVIPGFPEMSIKMDSGSANFARYDFNQLIRTRGASGYAPFGQCLVFTFKGQDFEVSDPVLGIGLDAGAISVSGPKGTRQFKLESKGNYSAELGGSTNPLLPGEEYLVKGTYTVTATGGTDVRAFTATLNFPDPLTWTNRDSINVISRSQDLTVRWSGGNPAQEWVSIVGVSMRSAPDVGAAFVCTERAAAGSFTVPSLVLSALPASQTGGSLTGVPSGILMVGSQPLLEPNKFRATGLDQGYIMYSTLAGKSVTFQ